MAEKEIQFTVGNICSEKVIVAPPAVVLKNKNTKINFENELGVEATVYFYKLEDKGGTKILNFCTGVEENGALKIAADGEKECKPNEKNNYSYTVEAPSFQKLDPIIIIEDAFDMSALFMMAAAGVTLGGGAVAGVFFERQRMKRKMRKQTS